MPHPADSAPAILRATHSLSFDHTPSATVGRNLRGRMDTLKRHVETAKKLYDLGRNPLREVGTLSAYCVVKVRDAKSRHQVRMPDGRTYHVFHGERHVSRPYRPDLFISSPTQFLDSWNALVESAQPQSNRYSLNTREVTRVLYTAITAVCACYDVWKPTSRKTPGTVFEIIMGTLLGHVLSNYTRQKAIPIPQTGESVSTDVVFDVKKGPGLVFAAKITTRERIVQPYAHQRILDSVFGKGRYKSFLLAVSELQRDEDANANEICVPGTIKLFQKHLAELSGIYYLDPPARYLQPDVTSLVAVRDMGELLGGDLSRASR